MPKFMQYAAIASFLFVSTAHAAGLEAKPTIVTPDHATTHVDAPKASVVDAVEKEKQGIQKAVQRSHINAAAEKAKEVDVKAPDSPDSPMKKQAADYAKDKEAAKKKHEKEQCQKTCQNIYNQGTPGGYGFPGIPGGEKLEELCAKDCYPQYKAELSKKKLALKQCKQTCESKFQ